MTARLRALTRFALPLKAWLGFSSLYALTGGTCPCCGQPSCPTGVIGAGLVGGLMALALQLWRGTRPAVPPPGIDDAFTNTGDA